jgi:hypothetical protein
MPETAPQPAPTAQELEDRIVTRILDGIAALVRDNEPLRSSHTPQVTRP